jgi:hypothetical protein
MRRDASAKSERKSKLALQKETVYRLISVIGGADSPNGAQLPSDFCPSPQNNSFQCTKQDKPKAPKRNVPKPAVNSAAGARTTHVLVPPKKN